LPTLRALKSTVAIKPHLPVYIAVYNFKAGKSKAREEIEERGGKSKIKVEAPKGAENSRVSENSWVSPSANRK
jgi:hypothetical protein